MIATIELMDILDLTDELSEMIIASEQMLHYIEKKQELKQNQEVQTLLKAFERKKEEYAEVQRFGRYHPDYSKITKETRLMKREIDMLEPVALFKVAERELQTLLEDISEKIAFSISKQIMVPREGALFTDSGCGHGGSCGCSA
ncbi:YlbF family regulator [Amphibacillus sp. MSJ-3]|uniref:YlbF family regulator n=1 Tax=Amphibacillus sp. MSJ-3 TaxID=2841505 RepID=UPI001C0F0468|nr:YlbF family regulator [Amphibacillus sp. MSJ-3]MBU5595560.1 YlbF family regulator [Amphibacillus sp. MSJ-3]